MRKNTIAKVGKHVVAIGSDGDAKLLEQLLTVGEAAAILRCSVASLNKWRLNGLGPKFVYVGRRVRYTPAAIAAFIAASTRNSTSDPGEQATSAA
jgi:hypothetical protein